MHAGVPGELHDNGTQVKEAENMTEIKQTMADVQAEAKRCLYCVDAPCQKGCPAGVDVAQFIRHLRYADL